MCSAQLAQYDEIYSAHHNVSIEVAINEQCAWCSVFRSELSRRKQRLTLQLTIPQRDLAGPGDPLSLPTEPLACDMFTALTDWASLGFGVPRMASSQGAGSRDSNRSSTSSSSDHLKLVVCDLVDLNRCELPCAPSMIICNCSPVVDLADKNPHCWHSISEESIFGSSATILPSSAMTKSIEEQTRNAGRCESGETIIDTCLWTEWSHGEPSASCKSSLKVVYCASRKAACAPCDDCFSHWTDSTGI